MIQAGDVRHVGALGDGRREIRHANAAQPITALQVEYSLMGRGIEAAIVPAMRELQIGATAYGVL